MSLYVPSNVCDVRKGALPFFNWKLEPRLTYVLCTRMKRDFFSAERGGKVLLLAFFKVYRKSRFGLYDALISQHMTDFSANN